MNLNLLSVDPSFFTSPAFFLAVCFVAAIIYSFVAKSLSNKKALELPEKQAGEKALPKAAPVSSQALELTGVDEKSAAVIMAIVSDKSGIPLSRLKFKSIKLMED